MTQRLYFFGKKKTDGRADMRALLGGKGANLAEMARIGLPVPPGFTITTEVCQKFLAAGEKFPENFRADIAQGIKIIEGQVKRGFGDHDDPLLLSVRSGAAVSMPGMMDTILNLGLNDETVQGLILKTDNPRFGFDSYRRLMQMYGTVVLQVPHAEFESCLEARKDARQLTADTDLTAKDLELVIVDFHEVFKRYGHEFPQDVMQQLFGAISAVFSSWRSARAQHYRKIEGIADDLGTACTIQTMVFGNVGKGSGTGVAFSRDPATGQNAFYGEYLANAQGEDVVAGIRTPNPLNRRCAPQTEDGQMTTLEEHMPECYRALEKVRKKLEKHYRDMQDIEFTIEEGRLWLLQTRVGKRTAAAAVRVAVELVDEGMISQHEALLRVEPRQIEQLLHPSFDVESRVGATPLATGLAASPGAAVGRVVFHAQDAVEWTARGEPVILVRQETSPDDIQGMYAAKGLLTARGGVTSHAAVVARGMGKPCVSGCRSIAIDVNRLSMVASPGHAIAEGDWISLDGSTGEIFLGRLPLHAPNLSGEFQRLMEWADEVRHMHVRANAETASDAQTAINFGAQGIGLARTEHMFFAPERINIVREMILADSIESRKRALEKLLPMQRDEMYQLLQVVEGRPITIRLLDPPLHEFLPQTEKDLLQVSQESGLALEVLRETVAQLHETNPMLGHRGCRIGVTFPEIYAMQVQAIFEAACQLWQESQVVSQLEIEVPLVAHLNELRQLRTLIQKFADEVLRQQSCELPYKIGAMLELPRACLIADQLSPYADFFSFGTNDLTQTVLGISRDDAGRFLKHYVDHHTIANDPFVTIDRVGVGTLVKMAVEMAHKVRPDMEFAICGEHGGDPDSIDFFHTAGLAAVSCSPYRVPVARLAAARSTLLNGGRK